MVSSSLYIHIPFCKSKCPYCGFYSRPVGKFDTSGYINAVIKEINSLALNEGKIKTIYLGGGTPTILPEKDLYKLLGYLSPKFQAVEEFTIETNPSSRNHVDWNKLVSFGINRVSVGVQSLIDDELKSLARAYKANDVTAYLQTIRQSGIHNIGIDLIFALPQSTIESWKHTLNLAIKLPVQHISAYSLSFDEGTHFSRLLTNGELKAIDQETDRKMYITVIEMLKNAGFEQYETSNFAREGFRCKHNLTYWENLGYAGVGPSAGSFHNFERSENVADIEAYITAIKNHTSPKQYANKITGKDYACETAILMLRTTDGINIKRFKKQTGFDLLETFAVEIDCNLNKKMLEIKNGHLQLTKAAIPIADSILCDFAS